MSKRTNAFQQVIHFIHQKLEGVGAKVTESAFLIESLGDSSTKREIDILIEKEINGECYRIAIECRDHGRPQKIGWIDELIGKYKNLPVHEVVAVSNTYFSKDARKKAAFHNISVVSLKEVKKIDFVKFVNLGLAEVRIQVVPLSFVTFETFSIPRHVQPHHREHVYSSDGKIKTVEEFVQPYFVEFREKSFDEFIKNASDIWKTRADMDSNVTFCAIRNIDEVVTFKTGIHEQRVKAVALYFSLSSTATDIALIHKMYEGALVSGARIRFDGDKNALPVYVAQIDGAGKVFFSKYR
ncbi:restriction endonuclease [Dawidia soli]|uniref:Restriction endonuclease n=1 Tax=Dawidia soli TaxID=2782352 RepID=A0AAP2D9X3_9BACT|nr:restriction endonuclease [Dawidia soli]MBT1688128.1 restriction endonuclease [Dawidia soli]